MSKQLAMVRASGKGDVHISQLIPTWQCVDSAVGYPNKQRVREEMDTTIMKKLTLGKSILFNSIPH